MRVVLPALFEDARYAPISITADFTNVDDSARQEKNLVDKATAIRRLGYSRCVALTKLTFLKCRSCATLPIALVIR